MNYLWCLLFVALRSWAAETWACHVDIKTHTVLHRAANMTLVHTQHPPRTPLDKAQSGVRAASSLLFKQTGAYSNPCFLSPRLVSKVTCQKRQERCWLPPRGQFPSFAQVHLTFGHMTPVPMTTRLRTAREHASKGSSARSAKNEDGDWDRPRSLKVPRYYGTA